MLGKYSKQNSWPIRSNFRVASVHTNGLVRDAKSVQSISPTNQSNFFSESLEEKSKMPRSSKTPAKNTVPRRKRRSETFNIYIFKVLKQVHPQVGMSKKAMSIMNSFVHDTFNKIATEAGNLVKYNKKATMDARAIQSATKLVLPGELAKHAETEGQKAVQKYQASK